jgi:hypothetical protein
VTRKAAQKDYDAVFEPRRSRSSRAKSAEAEPAASSDDVADFVEQQVRQITNAVRLMAAKLQPVEGEPVQPSEPPACFDCTHNDEPHLHGAVMYAAGKVIF